MRGTRIQTAVTFAPERLGLAVDGQDVDGPEELSGLVGIDPFVDVSGVVDDLMGNPSA